MKFQTMTNRRFLAINLIFFLATAICWHFYFRHYFQKDTVTISSFPMRIEEWIAEDLPLTDEEYAILETKNVLVRKYTHPQGGEIFLFIVYSQNNRKVSHPPEVCYTGSGVSVLIMNKEQVALSTAPPLATNFLLLEHGPVKQIAHYWFKVGDTYTSSYWKQQVLIAFKTLLGKPASSALIRVSMTIEGEHSSSEATQAAVKNFISLIYPHLAKHLP